jgi:hypothetical protein
MAVARVEDRGHVRAVHQPPAAALAENRARHAEVDEVGAARMAPVNPDADRVAEQAEGELRVG